MREKSSLFHKDGKTPLPIIAGPLQYSSAVASLDGSKLFVVGEQPRAELQRYDVRSRQFLPYLSSISAGQIDVSPDAQWVTYVSYPERSLWRSRADGSQRQQLTNPPMVADMPRWSADGKQIVFAGNLPGTISFKIFVIAADGGTPKELVSGEDTSDGDPNWAPDGSAIQFSRWPGAVSRFL